MNESVQAVKLLGVPYDGHSSFLRGPAAAPVAVRDALHCGSANYTTELGCDVEHAFTDLGDLSLPQEPEAVDEVLAQITSAASDALADGSRLLSIGGDHMVTWPLVRAAAKSLGSDEDDQRAQTSEQGLTIVHFDAHPDLYDELDGDRYSHACPFARIMEEGLATRLVQFGIRTITAHQREQAERFGVEVVEMRAWDGHLSVVPPIVGPVYVSIDIDALDPAFAPGISHYEPGGMTSRQLINCIHQIDAAECTVIAADLVEVNPHRDINDMTAMVGAKIVRELLGLLLN